MQDVDVALRANEMTAVLYCKKSSEDDALPRLRLESSCLTALYYVRDSREGLYDIQEVLIVRLHNKQGAITIARDCGVDIAFQHDCVKNCVVSVSELEIGMRIMDEVHDCSHRLMRIGHVCEG